MMNQEPDTPKFTQNIYAELDLSVDIPGGIDLHKMVDTVRACSFILKQIAHVNHEIKIKAEKTISDLKADLFIERKRAIGFQEEFNDLTQRINEISTNALEQVNSLKAEINELNTANSSLSLRNQILEDELLKANECLKLIYSTTASELKSTLDELERTQKINFIFTSNTTRPEQ